MKTFYATIAAGFLALLAATTISSDQDYVLVDYEPEPCALCFDMECYNSSMCGGSGCVCFKKGMDLSGFCGSIE